MGATYPFSPCRYADSYHAGGSGGNVHHRGVIWSADVAPDEPAALICKPDAAAFLTSESRCTKGIREHIREGHGVSCDGRAGGGAH